MNAAIIALARDTVDPSEITLETETDGQTGITADEHRYLDDAVIYSGTAAGYNEITETEVHVGENTINTEQVGSREHVAVDYYADFHTEPAWVGITSGKGEFLWDRLGALASTPFERATIDLDAFAREYQERDDAHVWQVTRERGPDSDEEGVQIGYHDDASTSDITQGGLSQLGFSYRWQDGPVVRGVVAASGYVAVYSTLTVEAWGRWLRDELLPYASLPESAQSFLDDATEDDTGECEDCGRDPEKGLEEGPDGRDLCVVCNDKAEDEVEERAARKLNDTDAVTVTDGGSDE